MTKVLGLTGGIASGKTTISNFFKSKNYPVVDADLIAREVMKAGTPVVEKIRTTFGEEAIQADGEINRKQLGAIIFASPEKRKQLDDLVHSEIIEEMIKQRDQLIKEKHALIVLDIPLLYEVHFEDEVDEVMVVYVDFQTQKERLLARNPELTEGEAENRIQAQLSLEEKMRRADIVIDNRGEKEETLEHLALWLEKYMDK